VLTGTGNGVRILAISLWGVEWTEKYSDWAIDRLMFRLRKQLVTFKMDHFLHVLKRRGFMFGLKEVPFVV